MYFSSSDYYDNPFDTNIFVDENKLSESLSNYLRRENDSLYLLKKDLNNMDIHIDLPTVTLSSFDDFDKYN